MYIPSPFLLDISSIEHPVVSFTSFAFDKTPGHGHNRAAFLPFVMAHHILPFQLGFCHHGLHLISPSPSDDDHSRPEHNKKSFSAAVFPFGAVAGITLYGLCIAMSAFPNKDIGTLSTPLPSNSKAASTFLDSR